MVFGHFNHVHGYLPTPEQILYGVVQAQIHELKKETKTNYQTCRPYVEMWQKIFEMVKNVEFRKPLTPKVLSDPNHKFVKTLIYIYSMQTFIFSEMNKASRRKDVRKIKYYGAFASALSFVVHCGNKRHHTEYGKEIKVYRGLQVSPQELQQKYQVSDKIRLQGFTSTTMDPEIAIDFAVGELFDEDEDVGTSNKCPVLIEINVKDHEQLIFLNNDELSAFAEEQEVLLQDGVQYKVVSSEIIEATVERDDKQIKKKLTKVCLEKMKDRYTRMNCCHRYLRLLLK